MERKFLDSTWRKKYRLIDMTTADVKRWLEKTDIVLLPVGSVEQHGDHMPLGTDIYTAMLVAYGAAEKADVPIAPEIWMGITPYHMHKPGTITVRYQTFANIIYDVCRSLIHHGFNKIVVSAGHKNNFATISEVARKIRYDTGGALVISYYRGEVAKEFGFPLFGLKGGDTRHGGEMETAGMLCWNPELVQMDKAKTETIHNPEWFTDAFKVSSVNTTRFKGYPIGLPLDHHEICDSGNLGDPRVANREIAEKIYVPVMDVLVDLINELRKIKVNVKNREFVEKA